MWFAAAGCALLIALLLGSRAFRNGGPIEAEVLMIRTAIASNRTFSQLIHSIATELPPNAEVYEIGEDALRVTRFNHQQLSRLERARRVKSHERRGHAHYAPRSRPERHTNPSRADRRQRRAS